MEDVYIASGVRTAIGRYGGALKSVPAHVLASTVMKEAVRRAGIDAERIDEVILGEVRQSTGLPILPGARSLGPAFRSIFPAIR